MNKLIPDKSYRYSLFLVVCVIGPTVQARVDVDFQDAFQNGPYVNDISGRVRLPPLARNSAHSATAAVNIFGDLQNPVNITGIFCEAEMGCT
jgi:hypothetical protein